MKICVMMGVRTDIGSRFHLWISQMIFTVVLTGLIGRE